MSLIQPLKDVKELASKETACVKKTKGDVVLCLHPIYAVDVIKGVTAELDSMSSRYSKLLGGIPMAYEKVGISSTGGLVHTSPFMHFRVQATFYIFQPQVGSVMEGIVKKKSPNHLSCLIHKMFNVSVPRPPNVAAQKWGGTLVEEGDVVRIVITDVDMSFFLPMITGRFDSKRVNVEGGLVSQAANSSEDKLRNTSVDSGISSNEEEKLEETKVKEIKEKKKGHKKGDVKVLAKKKGVKDIGKIKEKEKKKDGKKREKGVKTEEGLEDELRIKKKKSSDVEVKKEKKKKKKEKIRMKNDKVKVKTEGDEKDVKIKKHKSKKDDKVRKGNKKKREKEKKKKKKKKSKKEKKLKIKKEDKVKSEMPSSTTQVTNQVTPSKHSIKSKKRKTEESPGEERKKKIKLEESP